jgi:hypothetical protein
MCGGSLPTFRSWSTNCVWPCAVATASYARDPLTADFDRTKLTETGEPKVKVEVLYVAECSSHPAAVKLVRDILAAEGSRRRYMKCSSGRRNGQRTQIRWFSDHPNQWTRRRWGIAGPSELCAELPFVSRIETSRPSVSGDDSSSGAESPARGQTMKTATGIFVSVPAILSSVKGGCPSYDGAQGSLL